MNPKEQYGLCHGKTCLRPFVSNKGADQPEYPCRLISAFVIRLLESIISQLASSKISVAKETGLSLPLPETPKTRLVVTRSISYLSIHLLHSLESLLRYEVLRRKGICFL